MVINAEVVGYVLCYNLYSVAGSTVLSAAKNPSSVSSTNLKIGVVTKADSTGKVYDAADSTADTYPEVISNNEESIINSGSQFKSHLVSNTNGVITGIYFIQDGVTNSPSVVTLFGEGSSSPSHD